MDSMPWTAANHQQQHNSRDADMNERNIRDSIEVLKRVRDRKSKFCLYEWQENSDVDSRARLTEEELHTCGLAACVGGWIAVSPEFHAVGGMVDYVGCPLLDGESGMEALALYWDVDFDAVDIRCNNDRYTRQYYGVNDTKQVTIDMAIKAIESLLES